MSFCSAYDHNFPRFPSSSKSLARKHLTPELFQNLNNKKTARGETLNDIIKVAVTVEESQTGAFLGDEESYILFGPFVNAIIEDFHQPSNINDTHPCDFDPSHLHVSSLDPDNKYIKSTRIRVARNLKGYGLTPKITKEDRLEIESKVVAVLAGLSGDLKGRYYSLAKMDKTTQEKLVGDHLLFQKTSRTRDAAGINRDWPDGRGIYYNDEKTFVVWINEEDELRIISMQSGDDVLAVFSRLSRAVNELSKNLDFQFHPNLGYLAACPTNVGTGLRASVHINIPNAVRHPDFQKTLNQYHLECRGVLGEYSIATGGLCDISNKRRLGLTEVECVQLMYTGVKRLIEIDNEQLIAS